MTIQPTRDLRFEQIRIIAIIFVIGVHSLFLLQPDGTSSKQFLINITNCLFACGNGLFFFMSGKFALQKPIDESKLGDFYLKKFASIILPLLLYMVLYSLIETYTTTNSLTGILKITINNIFSTYYGYHFWFMYVLVGNILLSPFIAKAINGLQKKGLIILAGLGVVYNTIYAYTPYFFEIGNAWTYPFSLWSAYFILGGCIDKIITTDKEKKLIYIVGIVCFFIIMLKLYFFSYKQFVFDLMPSYTFYVIMVYILLQQITIKNEKIEKIVLFLGKRTYGIYLIHFLVIRLFAPFIFPYLSFSGFPLLLFIIACVFLISLLSSYLIELIIIQNIQKIIFYLRDKLKTN
ncbi:MAG: acyltransferase [Paludibacteraceae bacterium]|nr:acyltransferase [Paludibacteraceae bacterium]